MIELLAIVVATTLGLGALATGVPPVYREYRQEKEDRRRKDSELERKKRLYQIKARMDFLLIQPPSSILMDEFDRLELEERILLANELEPVTSLSVRGRS